VDIANALAERCRAGITVNLLLDGVGTLTMPEEYRKLLHEAGCRLETFRPLNPLAFDRFNYRNHRRILVVDGRVGITGGSGTSGSGEAMDRRQTTGVTPTCGSKARLVEQVQGAFAENWLEATGVAIGGSDYFPRPLQSKGVVAAQAVRSSPSGGSAAMYVVFLLAMTSAQRSIYITNPYFLPITR